MDSGFKDDFTAEPKALVKARLGGLNYTKRDSCYINAGTKYGVGKIIFLNGMFSVQFDLTVIMEIDGKYLTVVGNTFDNPDLIAKR